MSGWGRLPNQVKEDLETWFNCTEISYAEKTELARLYLTRRFHAWNCPQCGERVYFAEPTNWSMFQGVLQADYSSYPGENHRLCDGCRVEMPVAVRYPGLPEMEY